MVEEDITIESRMPRRELFGDLERYRLELLFLFSQLDLDCFGAKLKSAPVLSLKPCLC